MEEFMKKMNQYDLLRGVLATILGLVIIWRPGMVFNGIVYIIAAYFALMGLLILYTALREKDHLAGSYAPGILLLLVALAVIVLAKPIVAFIPFLLGLFVVIGGVRQLLQEIQLNRQGLAGTGWFIFAILMIIAGAVLLLNPFKSVLLMFRIFGVIAVIVGISTMIRYRQQRVS